ncbi:hypothetical protein TREES_T100014594 [Tupaia chinensis]|uniref:Uncharacterized protein n=1 Tax=Tupaia chinensis TaxID=246437 RepID=L9L1V1_TUPCH|nr:hypothetical protein TREES_T100014594 [Tupaia chinensis]
MPACLVLCTSEQPVSPPRGEVLRPHHSPKDVQAGFPRTFYGVTSVVIHNSISLQHDLSSEARMLLKSVCWY